jgi:hypothetical protein
MRRVQPSCLIDVHITPPLTIHLSCQISLESVFIPCFFLYPMPFDIGARHGLSDVDNLLRLQWCLNNVSTLFCGLLELLLAYMGHSVRKRGQSEMKAIQCLELNVDRHCVRQSSVRPRKVYSPYVCHSRVILTTL